MEQEVTKDATTSGEVKPPEGRVEIKNINEAISVLIQAAYKAQKLGVFELFEAAMIADSIDLIMGLNQKNKPQDETAS